MLNQLSFFMLGSLLCLQIYGQTEPVTEVRSEVNSVTVYLDGAQITRTKSVDLVPGRQTLKFVQLSPFIDPKSITIKATGDLTVLSVNHQLNFLPGSKGEKKESELAAKKEELTKKIAQETAYLEVLGAEMSFLKENSSIGGANTGINMATLKEAVSYFNDQVTTIKMKQLERNNTMDELNKELNKVTSQIASLSDKPEQPDGEVLISINAKSAGHAQIELTYVVSNAGWFPSYDIRVRNISEPADLMYKANVHQSTNEDWKNVRLTFSSSQPSVSGIAQTLRPYYLNYNTLPPSYSAYLTQVSGHIRDGKTQEPIPFATVSIKGTSLATVTDFNGFFTLTVPPGGGVLTVFYVGYDPLESAITGPRMDLLMNQTVNALNEVQVVDYKVPLIANDVSGVNIRGSRSVSPSKSGTTKYTGTMVETVRSEAQTSVQFEIKTPYTVPSDGKVMTIEMDNFELPAEYRYISIPKIDRAAFLTASIVNWEQYSLLEGEANVFFEGTYTGKTLIDARYMQDTLTISLGRDKSVALDRQIQKQFTKKQLLGSKKEETRSWMITVRNNKQQDIRITVMDQVPVSTLEEIAVSVLQLSGGKQDPDNGQVSWDLTLKPSEKKDLELKYAVEYPKNRTLLIE